MNRIEVSLILLVIILCFTPILQCKCQTSDLKIEAEPYQWDNDMKRLRTTTPERGLIFKITMSNDGTDSIEINKIYIDVRVETESRMWSFFKQLETSYLHLPPNEIYYRFVEIDFGGGSILGSYSAELMYGEYQTNKPIEPYPFDFNVVSEEEFERLLEENPPPSHPWFPDIDIHVTIEIVSVSIGSVALVTILWYWNKSRKEKQKASTVH